MYPSCLASKVQAGGLMIRRVFYWHILGLLVQFEHLLNATAYLSIVADHASLYEQFTILWWLLPAGSF